MKWNRYQLLACLCYLCAFNCFFSALFFPQLLQSLNSNSRHMAKSAGLIQDVNCIETAQRKKILVDPPDPRPQKGIPAIKKIDNKEYYDITITE